MPPHSDGRRQPNKGAKNPMLAPRAKRKNPKVKAPENYQKTTIPTKVHGTRSSISRTATAGPPSKVLAETSQALAASRLVDEQVLETGNASNPAKDDEQGASNGQETDVSGTTEVEERANSNKGQVPSNASSTSSAERGKKKKGQVPSNAISASTGGQLPLPNAQATSRQDDEQNPLLRDFPETMQTSQVTNDGHTAQSDNDEARQDKTRHQDETGQDNPRQDEARQNKTRHQDETGQDNPRQDEARQGKTRDQDETGQDNPRQDEARQDYTEETVQAQRSDATPRDGTTQSADTVYSSATPPLTQVENDGRAKAATEADGPEQNSRYGTVCYYAMREKSNLLVIVAYATDISPPEFFFLPDSSGDYRLPPGAAVRFWETDEPFNAGRRYGMRIYDCEHLFLEEVRPLTATIHPRSQLNQRQLGTKGIVGSRRVNGRLVNGIFPENKAMRFLYFDESLDARRCWPPPGTAVIATAVATADSKDAMLADVHLQDEQFQNMHQAIPRALVKHMNEHHLPTDTVTAMIGGDTSCDLPARNLMGSRAVRGHGDVPQLLREMLEYNRAQLNKAGEELQRIKERQTLVRALEKGEKIVLFVSTPFYNKFHWKRLFDAYFSRVTSGPTVSQVMLLTDFDARAVDAEQPFASTDFGEMITLDPGSDSTESFLVFTNPMPWEDDYQDGNLNFVTSRVGRKLFGLWLLSMKGCERSRSATGFPPLTYDRLFGRQPESRELSLAQPRGLGQIRKWKPGSVRETAGSAAGRPEGQVDTGRTQAGLRDHPRAHFLDPASNRSVPQYRGR
jgi:hypothetical protein